MTHSKLLQIFYLDKENEELLIKITEPTDRQNFQRFTTPPTQINQIHRMAENDDEKTKHPVPTDRN